MESFRHLGPVLPKHRAFTGTGPLAVDPSIHGIGADAYEGDRGRDRGGDAQVCDVQPFLACLCRHRPLLPQSIVSSNNDLPLTPNREETPVHAAHEIHLGVGLKKFYRTSSSFIEGTSFDDRTVKHGGTAASRPVWPSYRVHDDVAHRNRVCEVYRQARPTFVAFARYLTSMLTEILDINER